MSFTFEPHRIKTQEQRLGVIPAAKFWEGKSKPKPEACSPGNYIDIPINPFVGAIGTAYNQHRPLSLSPDAVWLVIARGFAMHVEANAEQLRHHFVKHEGKQYIEIRRDSFVKGSDQNDWPGAFSEFSDRIADHIGKKRELVVANFSTTTPTSKAASEIVLMDAMKSYFRYGMRTMCGFPRITLEGTVEDWEAIWTRTAYLSEFGLGFWLDQLLPVLEKFVMTAKGAPDLAFWTRAYKESGGSGGPYVSGWVNAFFPYLSSAKGPHKNHCVEWTKTRGMGGLSPDAFPVGLSKAPMLWHYLGQTFPMDLIGGLVGVEQDADGTLRPGIGWAIADDPEALPDHECEVDEPYTSSWCKHCGRTLTREQLSAQRKKLGPDALVKAMKRMEQDNGPPKNELDAYNRKDAALATVYKVSEPEYIGEMQVRSELFSEPYQPNAPTPPIHLEEKIGDVVPNPRGDK